MGEVLRFFVQYEAALYFVLGLGGILYLYRFWLAWQEVNSAVYGLEREESRSRLNQAAIVLFILLIFSVFIFILVNFVATSFSVQDLLATPTLDLSFAQQGLATGTPSGEGALLTATPLPTVGIDPAACQEDHLIITEPAAGDLLQGAVEVRGSVDVPNLGYYKLEYARGEAGLWRTIQAGRVIVQDGVLVESWDTSVLPPGAYVLQLVVTDATARELPPCRIPVQIEAVEE